MTSEVAKSRGVSRLVAALALLLLLGCVLIFGLILIFTSAPTPERQIQILRAQNPAFALEMNSPKADAQALAATQEAFLQSYGWIDQAGDIAHIPIDRAMELLITQAAQTATSAP